MNTRLALAFVVSGVLATSAARAAKPDTKACIAAFDQGQRSRSDNELRRAQTELLSCTQESCPAVLRADCAGVLRAVQADLPTIVLAAVDGEGHDISDVAVRAGAETIAQKIDGRAIELDPGTYDFRFERADGKAEPAVVHVVLRAGEKNRVVRATFAEKTIAPSVVAPPAAEREPSGRPVVGYVVPASLAAVSLAAFTVAGVSRLGFDSQVDDMRDRCAPDCTQTERADLSSTLVTANVALGIGIGAAVLAVASWFVLEPRRPERRAASLGRWTW